MDGLFRLSRGRMLPYRLGLGVAIGLGHEKQEWRKERSSDWIVLQTFTDEQWVKNFRMTRQTFNKVGFLNLIFLQWKIMLGMQ